MSLIWKFSRSGTEYSDFVYTDTEEAEISKLYIRTFENGKLIGHLTSLGEMIDLNGNIIGIIKEDNNIYDENDVKIGKIKVINEKRNIYNNNNIKTGYIDEDNNIFDNNEYLIDSDIIYYVSRANGSEIVWDEFKLGYIDVSNPCISGTLPDGLKMKKITTGTFEISGTLPIINKETSYYFTLRARYTNSRGEVIETDQYFEIIVKNKVTEFDPEQSDLFTFTETLYSINKIKLINAIGDEKFIKISGELPVGITLSDQGDLYGIASESDEVSRLYNFTIGVKRNEEIILEKVFQATVLKLNTLSEPIWITEPGNLGSINYNEKANDKFIVKAYDPNGLDLTYTLGKSGILPPGLSVDKYTGKIIGTCDTLYSMDWNFDIVASNEAYNVSRDFIISTNTVMKEDEIRWSEDYVSNILGEYRIGDTVFFNVKAISTKNITYTLLSNTLPKGLSMNSRGTISGIVDYQDTGDYKFVIEASNGLMEIRKTFILKIKQGLGYNALKCYLYINHEYDDEYTDMLGYFDRGYAYQSTNPLYRINNTPKIDICKCTCYDKTLMNHLLTFNYPLNIYWKKTTSKKYIKDGIEMFQAFYKEIQEENSEGGVVSYKGNKVYVDINKKSPTGYYLDDTTTPVDPKGSAVISESNLPVEGLEYIIYNYKKTYIVTLYENRYYENNSLKVIPYEEPWYIEEYTIRNPYTYEIETKQRKYIVKNNEKVYITQCENNMLMDSSNNTYLGISRNDVEIFRDEDKIKHYFIDKDSAYSIAIPSTSKIRDQLSAKIYVDKLNKNNVLYDIGSQEIISEDEEQYPEYILKYDNKRNTYYAEYNGEEVFLDVYATSNNENPVPVYAEVRNDGWVEEADNKDAFQESFDNTYDAKDAYRKDYKYILDGNLTKYRLVPVKVKIEYLNTDVDYKQYFVYDKESGDLQENIIFTLDWNKTVKFIIKEGKVYHIASINKPWVYNPSKNESIGYETKIVLPYISDDDVKDKLSNPYIRFFDSNLETLPVWKTVNIPEWKPNYYYKSNDIFYFIEKTTSSESTKYYRVVEDFKSSDEFDSTSNYIKEIVNTEISNDLDKLLAPYYFPTLDLFYSIPNANNGGNINAGKIDKDDYYYNSLDKKAGYLDENNDILDFEGNLIGKIDDKGNYYNSLGEKIGIYVEKSNVKYLYIVNNTGINSLNSRELLGAYWTNRKFDFFEVHFESIYNKNIDNFSIDFYNHNNKNTPEFRLI